MAPATALSSRWFALTLFLLSTILLAPRARAAGKVLPQIVRLSLVEGDVRFARGHHGLPDLKQQWQQAEINVPIEEGFSLATGQGRAEVEFEDGSLAYLAENSVIQFRELRVRDHTPLTHILVLIGTATFSIHHVQERSFTILTPREVIFFSEDTLLRVDRFVDGTSFTAEGKNGAYVDQASGGKVHQAHGQTFVYEPDGTVGFVPSRSAAAAADWDAWVDARMQGRNEEMGVALKSAGLTSPLPGLIDLYRGGTFFACAPYGTCWQPNESASPVESPITASGETARQSAGQAPGQVPGPPVPGASQAPQLIRRYSGESSCSHVVTAVDSIRDPVTGKEKVVKQEIVDYQPYDFALCHSGSWVHQNGRYVFVLGKKPHHHSPVCWVKVGNVKGFVPRHPDDTKGQPPKNLKYGVFVPPHTQAGTPARVSIKSTEKVDVLDRTPREFRSDSSALARVERPQIQSRLTALDLHGNPVPVRYDYNHQRFLQDVPNGHGATRPVVVDVFTSHGISGGGTGSGEAGTARSGSGGNHTSAGGGGGRSSDSGGSRSSDGGAGHSGGGSSSGGGGDRGRP